MQFRTEVLRSSIEVASSSSTHAEKEKETQGNEEAIIWKIAILPGQIKKVEESFYFLDSRDTRAKGKRVTKAFKES